MNSKEDERKKELRRVATEAQREFLSEKEIKELRRQHKPKGRTGDPESIFSSDTTSKLLPKTLCRSGVYHAQYLPSAYAFTHTVS